MIKKKRILISFKILKKTNVMQLTKNIKCQFQAKMNSPPLQKRRVLKSNWFYVIPNLVILQVAVMLLANPILIQKKIMTTLLLINLFWKWEDLSQKKTRNTITKKIWKYPNSKKKIPTLSMYPLNLCPICGTVTTTTTNPIINNNNYNNQS